MAHNLTILPDPPPPPTPIGLIAGGGQLPISIARNLQQAGHPVHVLALAGQPDEELGDFATTMQSVGLLRVGTWSRKLAKLDVRHAIMVGRVDKARIMHDPLRYVHYIPDVRTMIAWYRHLRHDRRSHAILSAIAEELDRNGIALLDSTAPIPDELSSAGVMTKTKPNADQRADIDFVWPLLAELLRLDIGQSVAVRCRDVVAVEAVEGTDRMIERAGKLCRAPGWTLCKGARAGHDRRADVPTVGPDTLENMAAAGGKCLALAAGDVIMLEKARMIDRADELGIAIVGVPTAQPGAVTQLVHAADTEAAMTPAVPEPQVIASTFGS